SSNKGASPLTHDTSTLNREWPLYDGMVDLWFERSARAGVGVSVGASLEHRPRNSNTFRSLGTQFPEFVAAGQTESIVIALPDFPEFASKVKEIVWSGL
uniref:hypothetical protein n=1 Tax=Micrococcus luteus TaxID=1270 RepID=UPI001C92CF3D